MLGRLGLLFDARFNLLLDLTVQRPHDSNLISALGFVFLVRHTSTVLIEMASARQSIVRKPGNGRLKTSLFLPLRLRSSVALKPGIRCWPTLMRSKATE